MRPHSTEPWRSVRIRYPTTRKLKYPEIPGQKRCGACKHYKSLDKFGAGRKGELDWFCLDCRRAKGRATYNRTPEQKEKLRLQVRCAPYNLTPGQFREMFDRQNGNCAACRDPLGSGRNVNIDHCHKTQRIRALLCNSCNCALGFAKDDPERLRALADYVENFIPSPQAPCSPG